MAIICRHATDNRATINGLTSRHSRSSSTAARLALCTAIRATVACKKTCRTAIQTKLYEYSFRADDGAHLQFMVVASNGIQTLLLFIRLRRWVASRVTETSCRGSLARSSHRSQPRRRFGACPSIQANIDLTDAAANGRPFSLSKPCAASRVPSRG
jgi:hypothetical protein